MKDTNCGGISFNKKIIPLSYFHGWPEASHATCYMKWSRLSSRSWLPVQGRTWSSLERVKATALWIQEEEEVDSSKASRLFDGTCSAHPNPLQDKTGTVSIISLPHEHTAADTSSRNLSGSRSSLTTIQQYHRRLLKTMHHDCVWMWCVLPWWEWVICAATVWEYFTEKPENFSSDTTTTITPPCGGVDYLSTQLLLVCNSFLSGPQVLRGLSNISIFTASASCTINHSRHRCLSISILT